MYAALALCAVMMNPVDLSGVYEVHGIMKIPDETGLLVGVPYSGTCLIFKMEDDYQVQWTSIPGKNIVGIGTVKDNTLFISWTSGLNHGMSLFEIGDKKLTGKWMQQGHWHDETMKFLAPLPKTKKLEKVHAPRSDVHDLRIAGTTNETFEPALPFRLVRDTDIDRTVNRRGKHLRLATVE